MKSPADLLKITMFAWNPLKVWKTQNTDFEPLLLNSQMDLLNMTLLWGAVG